MQGYITLSNHQWAGIMFLANDSKFSGYPQEVQALFQEVADEVETWEREELNAVEADDLKAMEEGGMVVTRLTPEQSAAFQERMDAVWDEYREKLGAEFIQRVVTRGSAAGADRTVSRRSVGMAERRVMAALVGVLDAVERLLAGLCVAAFAVMFVLGVATVVFRFLIQSSLASPDEAIRYLFVWMIALGTAVALRRGLHAAIGLFVDWLPGPVRLTALRLATLCVVAFMAVIVVNGVTLTTRAAAQISPALQVSMAWVYSALPWAAPSRCSSRWSSWCGRSTTRPSHDRGQAVTGAPS